MLGLLLVYMFIPKATKYKKYQKRIRFNKIVTVKTFRSALNMRLLIIAKESGRISSKLLETLRQNLKKSLKKVAKLIISIHPQIAISKKPNEIRMGKGKGSIDRWVYNVKPGTVLFEVRSPSPLLIQKACFKIKYKMPFQISILNHYE